MLGIRIDRQADNPEQEVQGRRGHAALESEGSAGEQDREGLPGERDWKAWDRKAHLGSRGNEQRTEQDQREMAKPDPEPVRDADRHEKVGDRDSALAGRRTIKAWYRNGHPILHTRNPAAGGESSRRNGAI